MNVNVKNMIMALAKAFEPERLDETDDQLESDEDPEQEDTER